MLFSLRSIWLRTPRQGIWLCRTLKVLQDLKRDAQVHGVQFQACSFNICDVAAESVILSVLCP